MVRRILIGGVTAAAIIGAGGTALALTGSSAAPDPVASQATTAAHSSPAGHHKRPRLLRRLSHAQIVVRAHGGFVTHDLIRGTVTKVSPTAITVQAKDKTTETFTLDQRTKYRTRTNGKGADSTVAAIHVGDHVGVAGTGTSTKTAKHVVDVKK
jgi:hypothetical protein